MLFSRFLAVTDLQTVLRGIAKGAKNIVLMLSYPSDEVGNHLVDIDELDEKGVNPWTDVLTEASSVNILVITNIHLQVLIILNTIKVLSKLKVQLAKLSSPIMQKRF